MSKVLALTESGELTFCTALPELRGLGRCNHIFHQLDNESKEKFLERAQQHKTYGSSLIEKEKKPKIEINRHSIRKLLCGEYKEDAEFCLDALFKYAKFVLDNNILSSANKELENSGADAYKSEIMRIDASRTAKHNAAMAMLSALNKVSIMANVDKVYPGEIPEDNIGPKERSEIAESIFYYYKDCFEEFEKEF